MIVHGHARHGRHRFALRSGDNRHYLARRHLHDVLRTQQYAVWNGEQAEVVRRLGGVHHAAAQKGHFTAVFGREVENLLQTMNGGTEAGDHQPARRADEQVLQPRPHRPFAFCIPGTVHVGRIRQQQQHPALAIFGQRVQIEQFIVGGRGIDFEIPGVDDDPERSGDGQRHRAHDGMRDVDELDGERTQFQPCRRA